MRREVALNRELERPQRRNANAFVRSPDPIALEEPSAQAPPRISSQRCGLGAGPGSAAGMDGTASARIELLIEQLNRSGFPAHLTLEQRLDRLVRGWEQISWRRWSEAEQANNGRSGGVCLVWGSRQ